MKRNYLLITTGVVTAFSCTQKSADKKKNSEESDNQKPNIIFIVADDLGYNDLGCYGHKIIKTPNINSLAAHGMRFTQCYSGATVCAPSRSVLMTGMHTGHTTVRGNFGIGGVTGLGGGEGRVPLKEQDTTIAQVLQKAGYVTAMVGKWGLGEPNTSGEPYKKGFDEFYGFLNQRRAHTYYPEYIWKDTVKIQLPGNIKGKQTEYTHDMYAEYTIDFIERNADRPFFLYLPFCLPHDKYEIPDAGIYEGKEWSDDLKTYAAMVSRLDKTVGMILNKIKEKGIDDNTYIFFTSDNGATTITGDWKMFESNAPFRGGKRDAYEGGIRVPMIVYHPEKIKPGQTNDLVWYFADVMPTLAELAGVSTPKNIDGISVLPTIHGKKQGTGPRYLYWEFYEREGWRAVRFDNWKAIQDKMHRGDDQEIELYNLSNDIGEKTNVADLHPDIIKKVKKIFTEAHDPSPNFVWDYMLEKADSH